MERANHKRCNHSFKTIKSHPPTLPETELQGHISDVKDFQITHGSLLKLVQHEEPNTVPSVPIGVSLYPTPFPRVCFERACKLQQAYNKLYANIACDPTWLAEVLTPVLEVDEFVRCLWHIYQRVQAEDQVQNIHLNIARSDYMLHGSSLDDVTIKQVEMNTFSVAGGSHGNIATEMHHSMRRKGRYDSICKLGVDCQALPSNGTIKGLVNALVEAHSLYRITASPLAHRTCVLMVVQPFNINICDERPIEYCFSEEHCVQMFRVLYGRDVLERTKLSDDKTLLFYEHGLPEDTDQDWGKPGHEAPWEVTIVYWRAGYDPLEYDSDGIDCRIRLEISRAIKCPPIAGHLTTFKRVQQALCKPGAVERFVSNDEASAIRSTFMPMYSLAEEGDGKQLAKDIATGQISPSDYVLKPSLEGGGHNIYGDDIAELLEDIPSPQWEKYVLMEMIKPPEINGFLMSPLDIYDGSVASELGIFGAYIWHLRENPEQNETTQMKPEVEGTNTIISSNKAIGWSFKTKSRFVNEMSVVKGFGCFDCPLLMDSGPDQNTVCH